MSYRIVIDTNVLVSAVLNRNGSFALILETFQGIRIATPKEFLGLVGKEGLNQNSPT